MLITDLRLLRGQIYCSAQLLLISIPPGNWSYRSSFSSQQWNSAPMGNQCEASAGFFWGVWGASC